MRIAPGRSTERPADEINDQQTQLVIDGMETLAGMLGTVLELSEKVEH
jgi:hypothetical protein